MLNQNINPAHVSFKDLDEILAAKAKLTIKFAIGAIDAHVEQLTETVLNDDPRFGGNIADRVENHNKIKAYLTEEPEWWSETDNLSVWGSVHDVVRIHMAKDEVNMMILDLTMKLQALDIDEFGDRPTFEEFTLSQSINELEHIIDNLANEPDDVELFEEISG